MKIVIIFLFSLTATAMSMSFLESIMPSVNLDRLKAINDLFSANMFQELVKSRPNENFVMSSLAVLSPLAQLVLASVGESHDEILNATGLPNDINLTKQMFFEATRKLRSLTGAQLNLTNILYVRKGEELNEEFATMSKDIFNSHIKNIDFSQPEEAAREMNEWVEDNTNHQIKDLISSKSLNATTSAVLVNTINLKGKWDIQFDRYETKLNDFYETKDKPVEMIVMQQRFNCKTGDSTELRAQLLELPYKGENLGLGTGATLIIIMPKKVDGITDLVERLKDPSALSKAIKSLTWGRAMVNVPKFKIETSIDLRELLQKMSIEKIFKSGEAGLDNLLKEKTDLFINSAVQKAYFEVNESGTGEDNTARHSNDNMFGLPAYGINYIGQRFSIDRPFYFVIRAGHINALSGIFYK